MKGKEWNIVVHMDGDKLTDVSVGTSPSVRISYGLLLMSMRAAVDYVSAQPYSRQQAIPESETTVQPDDVVTGTPKE